MNKRTLAKLPEEAAKEEYISLAKRVENAKYFVAATITEVEDEKILLLNFYSQCDLREEKTRASFRVFLNQDDYITQDLRTVKPKWKTASLKSLVDAWQWQKWCVCVDNHSEKVIRSFIKCGETAFAGLEDFQEAIMKKRLAQRHKKITDKIDKQMELVPELPEDFNKWIEETVLFKSRYIYYEYKAGRKLMKGYCTYCKTDVLVEKPRHNQDGICPHCKSPITYKALGKSTHVHDHAEAALFQMFDKGFIIRYFKVSREFWDHYKKPKTDWLEVARDFYYGNGNEIKSYEWADFKQTGITRWCDYNGKWYFHNAAVYDANLDDVLKDTRWKYSALKEFATHKPGIGFDVDRYLSTYKEYPFIEYLVKLKLYRLTYEIVQGHMATNWINPKGKNLQEILKISKRFLPLLQKIDASEEELRLVQVMEKEGLNLPPEQIRYIGDNLGCATGLLELSRYTTVNKALNYLKVQAKKIVKDPGPQCSRYVLYLDTDKNNKLAIAYHDWMDYIRFCKELKYDLRNEFILYPKDLRQEHDRASKLVQAKRDKEEARRQRKMRNKIKTMAKELTEKYGMEYKGLVIMAPKDADELIKEGQALHHCVGTYIKRIAEGQTVVLFIRKAEAPEEPYCTMEVTNGKIIQCRGKNNADMTEKLKNILNKFEKTKLVPQLEKKAM